MIGEEKTSQIVDAWLANELDLQDDTNDIVDRDLIAELNEKEDNLLGSFRSQSKSKKSGKESQGNSNKRKSNRMNGDDENDMHGIVDDIIEESRTKIATKKNLVTDSHDANKSKKQKIAPLKADKAEEKINATEINPGSNTEALKQPKTLTNNQLDNKPIQVNNGSEENKRKRKKTRSKQKNIRKDNRVDSQRPEHLRLSSDNKALYRGRQLTEETKKALGLQK